jgi:hypothetical protein
MRSSLPDVSKIIFVAVVLLVIIVAGLLIDWWHWPVWLIGILAAIGAWLVWRKLRQEE